MTAEASSLLPTLPGKTRGVVAVRQDDKGGNVYTLQCENCYALETPKYLVLLTFKFHYGGADRRRMCAPCRLEVFAACECFNCKEERRGA